MTGVLSLLAQTPLFQDLPEPELARLAATLRTVEAACGQVLWRQGERGETFYLVVEGELEIVLALGTPDERLLALRTAGEFLGEMSLLNPDGLRTASTRARRDSRLLEMSRADFNALLHRQPMVAYSMVRTLSGRLNESHLSALAEMQEKNRQLQQAYDELQAAQAQIIEKEKLERELQMAAEIQRSILPESLPEAPGYEFGACMQPARAVGGDFYDLVHAPEHKVGIVVGDVTDKGMPAAIFMAQTHALLRAEITRKASPAAMLRRVNRHLLGMNAGGLFATVFCGLLDPARHTLAFARAGHELPLLLSADGQIHTPAAKTGQPLGLFEEPLLDVQTLTLPPGSTLLLYTDGASDQFNPQREAFGGERLRHTLKAAAPQGPQGVCDAVLEAVRRHLAGAPQFDDITLVAVRN